MTRIFGLTGHRLPIHPQPLPDELLTHWMVRLAHANGMKVQTFADRLFGYPSSFWARDQDKMANLHVIEKLAEVTGKGTDDLMDLTLKPYGEYLYEKHNPNGNTRWILPLGVYHRTRFHGMQFCPMCLRSEKPYFRKYWRLSFYFECDHHQVLMMDSCPQCQAPAMFHRSELGHRYRKGYPPIVNCYRCGFDLSWAGPTRYEWADQQAMLLMQSLIFCHFREQAFMQNRHFESAQEFFDVLYILCGRIGSAQVAGELYEWVQQWIRPEGFIPVSRKIKMFERRTVLERASILEAAAWLLCDWPERMVLAVKDLGLKRKHFRPEHGQADTWILEAMPLPSSYVPFHRKKRN